MSTIRRFRSRPLLTVIAALSSASIAACGSFEESRIAASAGYSPEVMYSDCMRSHRVSNFPDPSPGGGFDVLVLGSGETASPAFRAAQMACAKLQPGGAPTQITGEQVHEMFLKAQCIRRHGFSNFPDPSLGPGLIPPSWNNEAPAAIAARKACARTGIAIPGWGVAWFAS